MSEEKYTLLTEFIDESESFTNGFECGVIWAKLGSKRKIKNQTIHLENSAQIQMMCDHHNVKCIIKKTADDWAELSIENYKL